jgi:hypothetical protein
MFCNLSIDLRRYRFDASGQSQDLGRRGCALLGSPAVFQLLLYEPTTKVQDVKCALTSAFQCVMSGTEYVSFYDEQQQYWSLRFDNVEGALMFARFIALIRESGLSIIVFFVFFSSFFLISCVFQLLVLLARLSR